MRIGIYDPYLDDLGGGEKYMMSIASRLSEDNQVDVFWDKKEDIDVLLQRFNLDVSKIRRVPNIFSASVGTFSRFFQTKKYDILIVLSDGSIPFVGSKKLFLHVQQPLEDSQTKSIWGKIKMSRVSKVFCNSLYTKHFVDSLLGISSLVVYPPVSLHAKKAEKENIILHVGRFRIKNVAVGDYKKQQIMIDAFKQMVDKGLRNWKFVIAAGVMEKDQKDFEKMQESAKGYPITFAVNRTNSQLWDLYSKAKIYWHASGYGEDLEKHPEFAEHFGISTVEAMGTGAVPVVINAGGQKEIVQEEENGLLWDTVKELQEKTLTLTKDAKKLSELAKNAAMRAQHFSFASFCQEVKKLLV